MAESVLTGFWVPVVESVPVMTCTHTQTAVVPCIGYLRSGEVAVLAPCCNAARDQSNSAKTTTDCQALCRSLEAAFKGVPGIKPAAFTAIPNMCGIYGLPFQLCPTVDCSKEAATTKCGCHCK